MDGRGWLSNSNVAEAETDDFFLRLERDSLAASLRGLAAALQGQAEPDPTLAMEAMLATLATIRCWLPSGTVKAAVAAANLPQLKEWETELALDEVHLATLREVVHAELHMSLRERNQRRHDLMGEPVGSAGTPQRG